MENIRKMKSRRDVDVRDTQEKGVREEGGNICLSLSDI